MGLQDELNALKEKSMTMIPKETASIMADALEELKLSNILDHSKKRGDLAPHFDLANTLGETISSKVLFSQGPVVINFYRGGW